jgi:pimeloyl-ACP methyl ester carboxylesterase
VVHLVALIFGLGYRASLHVLETYEPFPTRFDGTHAKYFRNRPSDGGSLEFHEYGAVTSTARVWFFVHGGMSTGGMLGIFPDFDARMKELDIRVVAPTMPGWGASDPYTPVFEITGAQWLERWARDTMALADHLGVARFAVSGLSLGGVPGLSTAAAAQAQNRLVAVAPLMALMWSHPGFDLAAVGGYSAGARLAMRAMQNRYLGSLAAETLRWLVMGKDDAAWEANPMLPPDIVWDRVHWGRDMEHSIRHQLAGQVQCHRIPSFESAPLVDWSVFDRAVPVYVFFGELDDTVPPAVATYTATRLPWAELRPFNGTHFDLDIFQVAEALFTV